MALSVVVGISQTNSASEASRHLAEAVPLVIDLDGTLLNSDLLVESLSSLVATSPLKAFTACLSLRDGKAALKGALAQSAELDLETLPWNEDVVAFMREQHAHEPADLSGLGLGPPMGRRRVTKIWLL